MGLGSEGTPRGSFFFNRPNEEEVLVDSFPPLDDSDATAVSEEDEEADGEAEESEEVLLGMARVLLRIAETT
eukprot:CAMPEP_0177682254 /NCGR_PEP_ID=MMETSP0447-20121125/31163_1 /TAXON_ID=0 /ORGANISM="Stygamoeba regulata, Strain BSH-02190019" /LENGTH=71 /DNA_ID=CAMNT_0019191749 /DNA_START=188 /DNA_END=403 /DNA_ORIENTATION=+